MALSRPRIIELLAFVVALLLGTLLSFTLPACSSAPAAHAPATPAQLASVVVLVERAAEWREPSVSSDDFGEHTGTYVAAWHGKCNAFALARKSGELYLVTALHCVRERALGSVTRYLPPDGWGIDRATLVALNATRDYAELATERQGGLVALQQGPAPDDGAPVVSVSAFFEAQAQGVSTGSLLRLPGGAWYGTTQSVDHGWSGSPVFALTRDGPRVWGYLARCETYMGKCARGAIVGAL